MARYLLAITGRAEQPVRSVGFAPRADACHISPVSKTRGTHLLRWSYLLAAIAFCFSHGSLGAQTFVQVSANRSSGTSSSSSALSSNTVAGNLVVVGLTFSSSAAFSTITDSQGNVFTQTGQELTTPGGARSRVYYARNVKGGPEAVTVSLSQSANFLLIYVAEYSGVDQVTPVDVQAGATGSAATVSSGNATTTVSGALIYGFCVGDTTCSAGSGFAVRSSMYGNLIEDMIAGASGSYSATGSADQGWAMQMVALRPATAPNFTVSVTPASQTVLAGANASYTVTVAGAGGFAGAVALSPSGLPPGVTASFNPLTLSGPGSSTLTINTSSSTSAATSNITITGTAGTLTQTAAVALTVGSSTSNSIACDVNKDGSTNVVDVQVATNNALGCTAAQFQTFVSQVVTGVLSSCPTSTGLHTVALNWVASTTSGVTYNVYRATSPGGYDYGTPLNSSPITGTSFTDCTVSLNKTYYYVIRAVDSSGNQSVSSNETIVSTPAS